VDALVTAGLNPAYRRRVEPVLEELRRFNWADIWSRRLLIRSISLWLGMRKRRSARSIASTEGDCGPLPWALPWGLLATHGVELKVAR
jgi:hypothetical protein